MFQSYCQANMPNHTILQETCQTGLLLFGKKLLLNMFNSSIENSYSILSSSQSFLILYFFFQKKVLLNMNRMKDNLLMKLKFLTFLFNFRDVKFFSDRLSLKIFVRNITALPRPEVSLFTFL